MYGIRRKTTDADKMRMYKLNVEQGLTHRLIAERMNMHPSNVSKYISEVKKKIRKKGAA